jgi:C1A family cysteine protease
MKTIRRYGWRKDTESDRKALGRSYRITRFKEVQYPTSFDLNIPLNPSFSPLDQGQLGSCTGFGCKRVAWYGLNAITPGAASEPSALFEYQNELILDGDFGQDNGSTISQGVTALRQYGICPEADWPYNPANFTVKAPAQAYTDAQKFEALNVENIPADANLGSALQDCLFNQRLPIVFGADLYQEFESDSVAQTGLVPMPAAGETPIGGHCQVIRGWKPATDGSLLFQIQNSWGGTWGDNGCDWMPLAYLLAYASDFWAVVQME